MHPIRPAGSRTDRVFMRISGSVNWDHWENDSWREGEREGCVTELPECDWVCVSCHWFFCQLWLTSRKDVLHPLWCQLRPLIDCWWQLLCVWLLIVAGCMNEGQTLMLIFCAEFSKKKKKKVYPPQTKYRSFSNPSLSVHACWHGNMKPCLSLLVKGWLRKVNLWLGSAQKMPDRVYCLNLELIY